MREPEESLMREPLETRLDYMECAISHIVSHLKMAGILHSDFSYLVKEERDQGIEAFMDEVIAQSQSANP